MSERGSQWVSERASERAKSFFVNRRLALTKRSLTMNDHVSKRIGINGLCWYLSLCCLNWYVTMCKLCMHCLANTEANDMLCFLCFSFIQEKKIAKEDPWTMVLSDMNQHWRSAQGHFVWWRKWDPLGIKGCRVKNGWKIARISSLANYHLKYDEIKPKICERNSCIFFNNILFNIGWTWKPLILVTYCGNMLLCQL